MNPWPYLDQRAVKFAPLKWEHLERLSVKCTVGGPRLKFEQITLNFCINCALPLKCQNIISSFNFYSHPNSDTGIFIQSSRRNIKPGFRFSLPSTLRKSQHRSNQDVKRAYLFRFKVFHVRKSLPMSTDHLPRWLKVNERHTGCRQELSQGESLLQDDKEKQLKQMEPI